MRLLVCILCRSHARKRAPLMGKLPIFLAQMGIACFGNLHIKLHGPCDALFAAHHATCITAGG